MKVTIIPVAVRKRHQAIRNAKRNALGRAVRAAACEMLRKVRTTAINEKVAELIELSESI
jgi:hypothetical protein